MRKYSLLLLGFVCSMAVRSAAQVPRSRHVWIITEENHSFEAASESMPYLMSLGNRYGIATQYYADMHNSLSALMHLTAGSTVTTDDNTADTFDVDNIVRHLLHKRLTFRSYQEGLPHTGFLGLWSGSYVKRHNPLAYFSDVARTNLRYNLVPLTHLGSDLENHHTANYNYVTPNLENDAHDGSLQGADEWLRHNVPPILGQPEFQPGGDGLLFVVFDEGNLGGDTDFRCNATSKNRACGGRVLTVVVGPGVKPGFRSEKFYNHESLLATVCRALQTSGCPGKANTAPAMEDFFIPPLSASPRTATVSNGQPAEYSLRVEPVSGFYDTDVNFSCGRLPSGGECYFSPATLHSGSDGASTTLVIAIPGQSAALRPFSHSRFPLAMWLGWPGLALISAAGKRRRLVLGMAALVVLGLCLGCGGGAAPGRDNIPATARGQTYTIRVTASSPSASYSVPLTVHVMN